MNELRARVRSLRPTRRSAAVTAMVFLGAAIAVAALVLGARGPAPTASVPTPSPSVAATAEVSATPTDGASGPPSSSPEQSASPSTLTTDLTQRPFTVLILGGDNGFLTDAIIVAGIDPVARSVTYASLPRDTIDVPIPGGGIFRQQKVNAFYDYAAANRARFPQGPGRATADMMQALLGIRIDFYAATTFAGFTNLVNAMGGVNVVVPRTVVDPYYQVTTSQIGIRFDAGPQLMSGSRALIYSRTRTGDSDFERSRRQQVFLTAAGSQLLAHPALYAALLAVKGQLITDFPIAQVPGLIVAIKAVPGTSITSGIVLGPSDYSSTTPCTCGYALEPNVPAIQREASTLFPWAVLTP